MLFMSLKAEGYHTSKSSPLAPTSCKLSKQFLIQQHLSAHYKSILNAKSSIDNKCPKSLQTNVNVKDQVRRDKLSSRSSVSRPGSASQKSPYYLGDMSELNNETKSFQLNFNKNGDKPDVTVDTVEYIDIIDKNSEKFTSQKCFTPRILKKNATSRIGQLRCYNPPKRKEKFLVKSPMKPTEEPNQTKENIEESEIRYLNFILDVSRDIYEKNVITRVGINQIFDVHINRNLHGLKLDQMLTACNEIQSKLENGSSSYDGFDSPKPIIEDKVIGDKRMNDSSNPQDDFLSSLHSVDHLKLVDDDNLQNSFKSTVGITNDCTDNETLKLSLEHLNLVSIEPVDMTDNRDLFSNRTVHFAQQNEVYPVKENEDHSLTDVTSMRFESDNDDATLMETMGKDKLMMTTLSKPATLPTEDKYYDKMKDYIDDFE